MDWVHKMSVLTKRFLVSVLILLLCDVFVLRVRLWKILKYNTFWKMYFVFYYFYILLWIVFKYCVQNGAVGKCVLSLASPIYTCIWRTFAEIQADAHLNGGTEAWREWCMEWCQADGQQGPGTVKWMSDGLTSGFLLKFAYQGNCLLISCV